MPNFRPDPSHDGSYVPAQIKLPNLTFVYNPQMRFKILLLLSLATLPAETYYRTFFHKHPVKQRIKPGEVVATKTLDSSGKDWNSQEVSDGPNPLTGPFYIE